MGDRFYDDLEVALSSYSFQSTGENEYIDDEEELDGDYDDDEEVNSVGNEGKSDDLACPFCAEDFDVLGLCCHIDADHRVDVKPGICPVCAARVGGNMASHVITQHDNILKALCLKKHHSTRSRSAIFLLRKDLQEKHLRALKESHSVDSSRGKEVDTMLLSFVNNPQPKAAVHEASKDAAEASVSGPSPKDVPSERMQPPLSDRSYERTRRCEFLQGLMFSAVLDEL